MHACSCVSHPSICGELKGPQRIQFGLRCLLPRVTPIVYALASIQLEDKSLTVVLRPPHCRCRYVATASYSHCESCADQFLLRLWLQSISVSYLRCGELGTAQTNRVRLYVGLSVQRNWYIICPLYFQQPKPEIRVLQVVNVPCFSLVN